MILDLHHLLILGIVCASLHWIVARSKIMQWMWSRATGWLASWLACAGCFGMWAGMALGIAGLRPVGLYYADEMTTAHAVAEVAMTGILAVFVTPVFEAILLWGLERSAIETEEPTESEATPSSPTPPHADHPGLFDSVDQE